MTQIFMAFHIATTPSGDAKCVNVMLLAAGRSTRLGALGLAAPKPLVPVCGYPAIRFGLHAAARAGARRAVVNVFHRGDLVQAVLGDACSSPAAAIDIAYSVENELLGTGGGLAKARPLFDAGPLLVMNAKVVADLDLPALLRGARARSGSIGDHVAARRSRAAAVGRDRRATRPAAWSASWTPDRRARPKAR